MFLLLNLVQGQSEFVSLVLFFGTRCVSFPGSVIRFRMGLFYWLWFHGQGEFLPLVPLPYTLYLEALTLYILLGLFYQILFTELLI